MCSPRIPCLFRLTVLNMTRPRAFKNLPILNTLPRRLGPVTTGHATPAHNPIMATTIASPTIRITYLRCTRPITGFRRWSGEILTANVTSGGVIQGITIIVPTSMIKRDPNPRLRLSHDALTFMPAVICTLCSSFHPRSEEITRPIPGRLRAILDSRNARPLSVMGSEVFC